MRGFSNERIAMNPREFRSIQDSLRRKKHVTGKKDAPMFMDNFHAARTGDVPSGIKSEFDLILGPGKFFWTVQ
jgi:hypothetical protein